MSRAAALNLLTAALAILAAMAMLGAAAFVGEAPAMPHTPSHGAIVQRFYDAANEAVRTGEEAPLAAVLSNTAVVRNLPPDVSPDSAGLIAHLRAMHAVLPDFAIAVDQIASDDDGAIAQVTTTGADTAHYLGLHFATPPPVWGRFNAFHIEGGEIVAVSSSADAVSLVSLMQTRLPAVVSRPQVVSFERLMTRVDDAWTIGPFIEPRVLFVMAGRLDVRLDASSSGPATVFTTGHSNAESRAVPPGTRVALGPGDALILPIGSQYALNRDRHTAALSAIAVTFPTFRYDGPYQASAQPVGDKDLMAETRQPARLVPIGDPFTFSPPARELVLALGRAAIPPGQVVAFQPAAGPLLVLAGDDATVVPAGADIELHTSDSHPRNTLLITVLPEEATEGESS